MIRAGLVIVVLDSETSPMRDPTDVSIGHVLVTAQLLHAFQTEYLTGISRSIMGAASSRWDQRDLSTHAVRWRELFRCSTM
jgi:hypothetical protein